MKNIVGKSKKLLPYLVAAAIFILLAVVYCHPVLSGKVPVSYTHLDVYKRQGLILSEGGVGLYSVC